MPIGISYQPPMAYIANLANIAGQGDFNRWQSEQDLRVAGMAQQGYQFEQQMAARQQAQAAEQQQQAWQSANRNQLLAWQRQNEVADRQQQMRWQDARLGQQRQWETADQGRQRQNQLTDQQTNQANDLARIGQSAQFQWSTRGAEEIEKEMGTSLAALSKQRQFLTPEGTEQLNHFQNEYRQRQKARDWARPEHYAQAMTDLAGQMERANLRQHLNVPPPSPEALEKETVQTPYGILGKDRSGAWRKIAEAPDDPLDAFLEKNLKNYQLDGGGVDIDAAKRDYLSLQALKQGLQAQMSGEGSADDFLVANGAFGPPAAPQRKLVVPTGRGFTEWVAKNRKSLEKTDEAGNATLDYGYARRQYLAEIETANNLDATDDGGQGGNATPRYIFELPEEKAAQLWATAPKPQTPAEVKNLPSGTVFITPDGRIKRVP